MLIGLYGRPQECLGALAIGAGAAGHGVQFRRPNVFQPALVRRGFGAIVTYGFHGGRELVHESYGRLGVPCIIADMSHLRRDLSEPDERYFQLGLTRLGWLPPFPCPSDRFRSMGVTLHPRVRGDTVLLAAQKPGDAAHWLSAEQLRGWGQAAVDTIRRAGWTGPIVWRGHPKGDVPAPDGVTQVSDPLAEPIADWFPRLHALVTVTSTAGVEALAAGVPVCCHPDAMYAPLASTHLGLIGEPRFPTEAERLAFFSRVAYAQWTKAELATPRPIEFVLACASGAIPAVADGITPTVSGTPAQRRKRSRAAASGADVASETMLAPTAAGGAATT